MRQFVQHVPHTAPTLGGSGLPRCAPRNPRCENEVDRAWTSAKSTSIVTSQCPAPRPVQPAVAPLQVRHVRLRPRQPFCSWTALRFHVLLAKNNNKCVGVCVCCVFAEGPKSNAFEGIPDSTTHFSTTRAWSLATVAGKKQHPRLKLQIYSY